MTLRYSRRITATNHRPGYVPGALASVLGIFLGIFATLALAGSAAENTIKLYVGVTDYPPYIMFNNGKAEGIAWDLLEATVEADDIELVAQEVPRARLETFIAEKRIDAALRPINWTPEPERFIFSEPLLTSWQVLFFPADSKPQYSVLGDLSGYTIAAQLGMPCPPLEPHFERGTLTRFDVQSLQGLFDHLLASDDIQAAVTDVYSGLWTVHRNKWEQQILVDKEPLEEIRHRIMFHPDHRELADQLNETITRMRDTGELEAIKQRYLSDLDLPQLP